VVFARTLESSLGKLCQQLDRAVVEHKNADLRAWVTFLNEDQLSFDPKVVEWSKKYALRNVPLGVFEDVGGPPSYRLARDAEVTVLVFVKQKVVANFAFRQGEPNDQHIAAIMKTLPKIVRERREKGTVQGGAGIAR
jgi:hypothetical protein